MNSSAWYNLTKLPVLISFSLDPLNPFSTWVWPISLCSARSISLSPQDCSLHALCSPTTANALAHQGTGSNPTSSRSIPGKTRFLLMQFFFATCRHLRDCITNLIINSSALILSSFMLVIFFPAGIYDLWRLESCFIFIYNSQWVAKYWVINPADCLIPKFLVVAFKLLGTFLMLLILSEPHNFSPGNLKSHSGISRTKVPSSNAYRVRADS